MTLTPTAIGSFTQARRHSRVTSKSWRTFARTQIWPTRWLELTPDPRDELFDTAPGGAVPRSWFGPRRLAQAELEGTYVDVQHADSIAALRPMFLTFALSLGLADFDGAAIRNSEPRDLTQQISRFLWEATSHDGVRFESRFGNGLRLYAIFERPKTSSEARARSTLLSGTTHKAVPSTSADFVRALALHGLTIDESR